MKKMGILAIILAVVVMLSACGALNVFKSDSDTKQSKTEKRTVVETQVKDETKSKDELTDKEDENNTVNVSDQDNADSGQQNAGDLSEAEETIQKYITSEYEIIEYDDQYSFVNKAAPSYDFSDTVIFEGAELKLPCTYNDLEDIGLTSDFKDDPVFPNTETCAQFTFMSESSTAGESDKGAMFAFCNRTEAELALKDCRCTSIGIGYDEDVEFEICGITQDMTMEEIISILGEPTEITYGCYEGNMIITFGSEYVEQIYFYTGSNGAISNIWFTYDK